MENSKENMHVDIGALRVNNNYGGFEVVTGFHFCCMYFLQFRNQKNVKNPSSS